MLIPTITMAVLAVILSAIAHKRGKGELIIGLKSARDMLIQIAPLLVFAFIVAGMIQVLIPTETISKYVGSESGFSGILIGAIIGGLMPGGPFISLPIAAGLLVAGAGVGTMVAFMTGWSIWAISRLPIEVGIMGWRFTAIRLASSFLFPVIAGLIANLIFVDVVIFD
jgi:uncharacterized membrane protein YraQ (UPF0718 family)